MISIFDWYNQETQDLHYTLKQQGNIMPTIVLEETGFLPKDVITPYQYFCQWNTEGTALYFNQVPIDTYDEIIGNNMQANIFSNNGTKKGRIIYQTKGTSDRIVKEVLWFVQEANDIERYIAKDHYNQYGFRYAQTIYNESGKESMKFYYNNQGKIVIIENKLIGDVILFDGVRLNIFKRKLDFIKYFLNVSPFDISKIFYNTLATSFFVTLELKNREGKDVLFWHEKLSDPEHLPGNMQLILNGKCQTSKIYFQIKEDYDKLKALDNNNQYDMINYFGYNYPFKRENMGRKEILILTNSDQIEGLQTLVESLPDFQFHIASLTEMSKKLIDYQLYENVHLYPNISPENVEFVFKQCDIYLDINYGNEILGAVRQAFLNKMTIFAFTKTVHNSKYVPLKNIFSENNVVDMITSIKSIDFAKD